MGALVRFKAMACWLASAISLRKAGDEPETGAGEPATDTEKPRVVEVHALPPGDPSEKLSPWAVKRRFETLLSGLRFDSRDDLDLAGVLIETVEAYLDTSEHEWADDYRLYLAGLRFVRLHDPKRFRPLVELHAWRIAGAAGLDGAETPWPPRVDESGRLSLRETALLWHRFAPGGESWSDLDLARVRSVYDGSRDPLLRAAWRLTTRSRSGQLTERHRRAFFGVTSDPLGFLRLAAEEANDLAETHSDLHALETMSWLLADPIAGRRHRFGILDLSAQVYLDRARAHQRRGENDRTAAQLVHWESFHDRLPAECVESMVRSSIVELRSVGDHRQQPVGTNDAVWSLELIAEDERLPASLRAEVHHAVGERALGARRWVEAIDSFEAALATFYKVEPLPIDRLTPYVRSVVDARWSHFVDDLYASGFYRDGVRSQGVLPAVIEHKARLEESLFQLEDAAHAWLRAPRDDSASMTYRWSLGRALAMADPAQSLDLMTAALREMVDRLQIDRLAELASDLLVPLLLLDWPRERIHEAPPLRLARRVDRDLSGVLSAILDGSRHPLHLAVHDSASAAIRELAVHDSAMVH